jgi:DNA polymerase III subunit beta
MKLTAPTKILAEAMAFVAQVLPTRSMMPVTDHVCLELAGPRLILNATDFDAEHSVVLDIEPGDDGTAVVPAERLAKLLARISSDAVVIDASAGKLTVRAKDGRWSLPRLENASPPRLALPDQGAAKFRLSQAEAQRLARRTSHAVSTEEVRFYLSGVFLHHRQDGLIAAATDSRQLAEILLVTESDGTVPDVIIPKVAIEALHIIAAHGDVEVVVDDRKIAFASGAWHATSKLIDGTFPAYGQLIPAPSDNQVTVDSSELTRAVARLVAIAAADPAIIGLCWGDDGFEVCLAQQEGASEKINATVSGTGRVAVQSKYLTDTIRAFDGETITIDRAADRSPAIFTSSEPGTRMLILPITWALPVQATAQAETSRPPRLRTARGK